MQLVFFYLIGCGVLSVVTFLTYGYDKRQASRQRRRISERSLHLMALLGGWPGAWMAQRTFRHKTQKPNFRLLFWCTVIAHLACVTGAVYVVLVLA